MELFTDQIVATLTINDLYLQGDISDGSIYTPTSGETITSPDIVGGTITGTSYRSNINGARFEIFPTWDPTIAQIVYNSAGTQTFKIEIDGTNTGDITLGDYAGGQGVLWDNSANTFSISGSLVAGSIHIPDQDTTANSYHVDTDGSGWVGATTTNRATAPMKWTAAGALTATSATITGAITISSGSGIANLTDAGGLATADTADFDTEVSGTEKPEDNATLGADWSVDLSNIPATLGTPSADGLYLSSTYLGYYKSSAWTSYIRDNGDFYFAGDAGSSIDWNVTTASTLTIKGKINAGTGSVVSGTYLTNGTVTSAKVKPSMRGSSHDLVFSATDANTVAWASGTITLSDGTSYSIDAGETDAALTAASKTSPMASRTYIYLDIDASETVLQASDTFSDAVGESKILIASAEDGTGEATFSVIGGIGGINIDANSIIVTNLAAIKADLGTITAGNITLDSSGFLRTSGKDNYADTTAGIFLGYDTDAHKLNIGDATHYMKWSGSSLSVLGGTITGGIFQTAATGQRVRIISDAGSTPTQAANSIGFIDASNNLIVGIGTGAGSAMSVASVTDQIGLLVSTTAATTYSSFGVNHQLVTSDSTAAIVTNAGLNTAINITNTNASNTSAVINMFQQAYTDTDYRRYFALQGADAGETINVYVGDAITPNGNLTGAEGDVCFNGDSGKIYYCTGTTNWTTGGPTYKNGTTTYDVSTADATQTIAHGLGVIPKKIRLTFLGPTSSDKFPTHCSFSYNGTTGAGIATGYDNATQRTFNGTTARVYSATTSTYTTGTVTFDATNISIAWVKTNSPTGTTLILWEAE